MVRKDKGARENDDGKKNTSLRLDKKTLKALKIRAIEEDTSVQKIIEQLIEAYLLRSRKKD
jgi:hypothetical protein